VRVVLEVGEGSSEAVVVVLEEKAVLVDNKNPLLLPGFVELAEAFVVFAFEFVHFAVEVVVPLEHVDPSSEFFLLALEFLVELPVLGGLELETGWGGTYCWISL
jgi:hypothetical protein